MEYTKEHIIKETNDFLYKLERLKEQHINDKYHTFQTRWIDVVYDCIRYIKTLKEYIEKE